MEWKTKLSYADKYKTLIRGYEMLELMEKKSFSEVAFLLLKGELPNEKEKKLFDALLVCSIDHGVEPASVLAARSAASTGIPMNSALAVGIASLGKYHGGAISPCCELLESNNNALEIVEEALEKKERLPGFGHKVYTDYDPRTRKLFTMAEELGLKGKYCEKALEIEKILEKKKGRKLCLNVDGTIATILLEMGFPSSMGNLFFSMPRAFGLGAHVHEEQTTEKPVRRLEKSEYLGEKERKVE
jgi:citryl-CoA lyase